MNGPELIMKQLERLGLPLTREKYLALDYPEGLPLTWGWEGELELPEEVQVEQMPSGPVALAKWAYETWPEGRKAKTSFEEALAEAYDLTVEEAVEWIQEDKSE